jgi:hypothetical protein
MSALAARAALQGSAPVSATLAGWALLAVDGLALALPQRDIVTIELVSALQPAQDGGQEIGWFAKGTQRWPVYCLDRRFAPVAALEQAARVCVLFRSEGRTLGLAGAQVSLLAADADLDVRPLPACLTRPGSPLVGLALHRDATVSVVQAQALGRYLSPPETAHAG